MGPKINFTGLMHGNCAFHPTIHMFYIQQRTANIASLDGMLQVAASLFGSKLILAC